MIKITLTIEMVANGYVLTQRDDLNGITDKFVFATYPELTKAIGNMVLTFER